MSASTILVLIGLRLSGKSTLGSIVAAHLQRDFVDLDHKVLQKLGATSVTKTFHDIGEAAWREAERVELTNLLAAKKECVISLGGGTPTAPGVADILQTAKARNEIFIALLDPGETELVNRLTKNRGDRPLLNAAKASGDGAADATAEVRALFESRMPLYRSLANVIVDTNESESVCAKTLLAAFDAVRAK